MTADLHIQGGELFAKALAELMEKHEVAIMRALTMPPSMLGPNTYSVLQRKIGPIESAGIRVGEITAYRLWRLDGHRLRSVAHDDVWLPGQPMTGDPRPTNHAGVYAFRERADAERELYKSPYNDGRLVLGTVSLWGQYVEHERGFRAENARIVGLDDATSGVDLDVLRTLYVDRRCPPDLTPVVDSSGAVVGVTTLRPLPKFVRTYSRFFEDERAPIQICEPMRPSNIDKDSLMMPETIRYQTHRWRGKALLLEADQDPTWLHGWLPL